MRAFHPLTGTFDDDLVRYAGIVEATGPFFTRTRDATSGPRLAVSKAHVAYESRPDQLWIAARDASGKRRFDGGLSAAYDPSFSPDGSRLAFRGCKDAGRAVIPGKWVHCPYYLFVGEVSRGTPARIGDVFDPSPPTWSLDGRHVYAVHHDRGWAAKPDDRGGCLYRVDAAPPHEAKALICLRDHYDLEVKIEPDGSTAIVAGKHGTPGVQDMTVVWVELPSGAKKATIEIPRGTGLSALGPRGLFATHSQKGHVYVDLATNATRVVPEERLALVYFSDTWTRDGDLIAHRRVIGGDPLEEVVAIDVRALAHR